MMKKRRILEIFPIVALFGILICANGCRKEEPESESSRAIRVGISNGVLLQLHPSRAAGTVDAVCPTTIGVFAFIDGYNDRVFDNQQMYLRGSQDAEAISSIAAAWPVTNDWPYDPVKYWIMGKTYSFYAYAPYDATNADIIASGYDVSSFSMKKIPPVSEKEFTVCSNLVKTEAGTEPTFTMIHLTSRLRFRFAIEPEYHKLRDIKLKNVIVTDDEMSGTPYWEFQADLTKPTSDFTLTQSEKDIYISDGPISLIPELEEGTTELKLEETYKTFSSLYNLIKTFPSTRITVVYDVYDKKGVKTRENQTVSNLLNLTHFGDLQGGHCYDVNILVAPKYLYVLSDNDISPDCILEVD